MNEQEVQDMLDEAATTPDRRTEIWDQLQAEARGNADQLTLPDKVKLDGILELLEYVFAKTCETIPQRLRSYAPIIHAVCSERRTAQLFDSRQEWIAFQREDSENLPLLTHEPTFRMSNKDSNSAGANEQSRVLEGWRQMPSACR